jgi:potassium-dependent mechanosensitive channel
MIRARGSIRILVGVVIALAMMVLPVYAQEPVSDASFRAAEAQWRLQLDRSERELSALKLDDTLVQRLISMVDAAKAAAESLREPVQAQTDAAAELLNALGAAPAAGQPAEDAETTAKRKELGDNAARLQGWMRQIDLASARADQLRDQITSRRIELYARQLLERRPSPLTPTTWTTALAESREIANIVTTSLVLWWNRVGSPGGPLWGALGYSALLTAIALVIGIAGAWLLRRQFGRPRIAARNTVPFSREKRLIAAVVEATAWAIPPLLAVITAWNSFFLIDLPNAIVLALLNGLAQGIAVFIVSGAAIRITLAPYAPSWRLPTLGDAEARALSRRLMVLAGLIGLDYAVDCATQPLANIEHFASIWLFLLATTAAIAVTAALDIKLWPVAQAAPAAADSAPASNDSDDLYDVPLDSADRSTRPGRSPWKVLRVLALAAVWVAPVLAANGYGAFAQFLYDNVIETAVVVAAATLLHSVLRDYLPALFNNRAGPGARLSGTLGLDEQTLRLIEFWITLIIDFIVVAAATLVVLMVWGIDKSDILHFVIRLIEGVRIGPITLSLTDVLLAIAVFAGVVMATRFVQHVLESRVFPGTQLDTGVRHSLRSGIGYVGLVIAAGLSISTLGLNLSNLAIVVGALTVGIGFGLQNIVNNFVSGLILLVERPIKVGDWVVVGEHQGVVRRINVRATEIETFQRAAVLIPNGNFLAANVVNWTHRNQQGRLDIPISVSGVTDARAVADLLVACARRQPGVAAIPRPHLLLRNFAGNDYQFELRVHVQNVYKMDDVGSELRFAIDTALRDSRKPQQAAE